jgi:hypothetical protein
MDFSLDFLPNMNELYYDKKKYDELLLKIQELEKYKEDSTKNINSIHERLNRHNTYYDVLKKKITEIITIINNDDKIKRINEIITTLYDENKLEKKEQEIVILKFQEIIQKQNIDLQKIIQNQKEKDKIILELQEIIQKQKEQDKIILDLQKVIQKQKEQEKQILDVQEIIKKQKDQILDLQEVIKKEKEQITDVQKVIKKDKEQEIKEKSKKRSFENITDDYIERLKITKERSKPWQPGMSKYICITVVNDHWRWTTNIFDENHKNFKEKEEAEKHFEKIIAKYNIDPIYITRIGYK